MVSFVCNTGSIDGVVKLPAGEPWYDDLVNAGELTPIQTATLPLWGAPTPSEEG